MELIELTQGIKAEADPRSKKPKVVAKKPDSDEEEDEESESTLAPAPGFTPVQSTYKPILT